MSWNQNDIDLLEAYQKGLLSEQEKVQVEARLVEDQEFKSLWEELQKYQAGLRHAGRKALKAELQALEQSLPEIETGKSVSFFRPNLWLRAAAGITIIFGLGILFFFLNDQPVDIDGYLEPYPNIVYPVERGASEDSPDARQLAYQAYDRAQYETAVERFTALPGLAAEDHFYLGLAYMLQGEYAAAATSFESMVDAGTDLALPGRWYLGLCYLKLDNREAAKKALQPLIDQKTSYAEKAENILNQTK